MASSQSYSDFEQDYNTHLSKIRSFLAQSTTTSQQNNNTQSDILSCEEALSNAKQCIHAMQGLAEIEGDPFKATEAKRKLERDIGPLEDEIKSRKNSSKSGGISSVFKRNGGGGQQQQQYTPVSTSDENYLFGNNARRTNNYAPPSMMGGGDNSVISDIEDGFGNNDLTTPLTASEQMIQDSQELLLQTQMLCAESEQIGASTLETMGRQREQIERSGGLILQSIENTEQARAIMKQMAYRALKNKIFLYCVIALLLIANGAAIVHLWRKK